MNTDPFFLHERFQAMSLCRGCSISESTLFCGASIRAECLRIDAAGTVRVRLAVPEMAWMEILSGFDEMLHLSRNAISTLGIIRTIPEYWPTDSETVFSDWTGLNQINLAQYGSLWAFRQFSPVGIVQGFEVFDLDGHLSDRFVLPIGAKTASLREFVNKYQVVPEEAGAWFSPNHAASLKRERKMQARIPWLKRRAAENASNVFELEPADLINAISRASGAGVSLKIIQFSSTGIRLAQANLEPEKNQNLDVEADGYDFIAGNSVRLRIFRRAVDSVWLWTGNCDCCQGHQWALETGDRDSRISLAVMSASKSDEELWRSIILKMAGL